MNRDLTLAMAGTPAAGAENVVSDVSHRRLCATPTTTTVWRHTLILAGGLHAESAADLQDEIECLYQEGVTSLVLDLRRLDVIELGAVRALASLSALYRRRGIYVSAIGGRAAVDRALMEAEAVNERIGPRRFASPVAEPSGTRSTEMIKQL
jgi:anti-anti-sigma regulatory factor